MMAQQRYNLMNRHAMACSEIHFMGCATRHILFIFGATPICVESYLEYYNIYI